MGPGNPRKLGLPKIKQQEKQNHPLDAALPLALAARGLVGLSSRSSDVGGNLSTILSNVMAAARATSTR